MPQIGTGDVIGLQTFFNYLDDLKKKCSCDQIYDSLQRSTQEFNVKITSKDIQNLFQNLSEILPPLATANHNYLPTFTGNIGGNVITANILQSIGNVTISGKDIPANGTGSAGAVIIF